MNSPLDSYLKNLKEDMKFAIENEDCSINVTTKDVDNIEKIINREKRRKSQLERERDIRNLFENKFVSYRNKLLSIYYQTSDKKLKSEIKHFLEVEQGDVEFRVSENVYSK